MKGMAWVRVLVGAVWLNGALEKLLNPDFPAQFADSLAAGGFVSQAPPFFRAFMEGVVAPNAEIFAQVVRLTELSLGLALVLGALTNLAALGSVGQSLSIMLSQGGVGLGVGLGAPEFLNFDLLMALLSVLILLSPGAKLPSLDAALARRRPRLAPLLLNRRVGGGGSTPASTAPGLHRGVPLGAGRPERCRRGASTAYSPMRRISEKPLKTSFGESVTPNGRRWLQADLRATVAQDGTERESEDLCVFGLTWCCWA